MTGIGRPTARRGYTAGIRPNWRAVRPARVGLGASRGDSVVAGGVAVAQKSQSPVPAEPKKRGRDWGFLLFIAGVLLIAVGTQLPILVPIGIAFVVVVVIGIIVRFVKQLYF